MMEVREADWKPLEAALEPDECARFMYMGHAGDIVLYKHWDTRKYLNIQTQTGTFFRYDGRCYVQIEREVALKNVFV